MPNLTYAVHTESCTYLLDEDGVCRWVVSPTGVMQGAASAAVGAQFVACLDLRVEGALVAGLAVGAQALFAKLEDGRQVLLRTTPIARVETRGAAGSGAAPPKPSKPSMREPTAPASGSARARVRVPPPRSSGGTETITLVKPLFRAPPAPKVPKELAPPRPPTFEHPTVSPPSYQRPSSMPIVPAPPKPRRSGRVDGPKKRR